MIDRDNPASAPGADPASAEALALRQLHWRCRRGLLEMDLLLQAFREHGGPERLSPAEREIFAELLDYDDATLLKLCLGTQAAPRPEMDVVLQRLRQAARP